MSMQTQNAAAERIGGVKCCEVAKGSLTEITPVCAATLMGTASLIAAWKSTSESDRVMVQLKRHRDILAQDVGTLRMVWPICVTEAAKRGQETATYLRSQLVIPVPEMAGMNRPTDSTAAAWHPFILEYCRTLGVVGDAVDRLYQRIVSGDITDKRAVETEADDAFTQLDAALALARAQWKAGESAIKAPDVSRSREPLDDSAFDAANARRETATHGPDFRSVNWFGVDYEFTSQQAACVKVLWEAWKNGTPVVGDATVLELGDSNAERLPLVFRDHRAWGTMIVEGQTKGSHRLADPQEA